MHLSRTSDKKNSSPVFDDKVIAPHNAGDRVQTSCSAGAGLEPAPTESDPGYKPGLTKNHSSDNRYFKTFTTRGKYGNQKQK